jgi:hypothetical protein
VQLSSHLPGGYSLQLDADVRLSIRTVIARTNAGHCITSTSMLTSPYIRTVIARTNAGHCITSTSMLTFPFYLH